VRAFVDTNVLVYLFDGEDEARQRHARELIATLVRARSLVVSSQVLGELYVTVTRKLAVPLPHDDAARAIDALSVFPVIAIDVDLVRRAVARCRQEPLSYWDALIVEAAVEAGAATLYTEDLQAGQSYRDITVVDPFAD